MKASNWKTTSCFVETKPDANFCQMSPLYFSGEYISAFRCGKTKRRSCPSPASWRSWPVAGAAWRPAAGRTAPPRVRMIELHAVWLWQSCRSEAPLLSVHGEATEVPYVVSNTSNVTKGSRCNRHKSREEFGGFFLKSRECMRPSLFLSRIKESQSFVRIRFMKSSTWSSFLHINIM